MKHVDNLNLQCSLSRLILFGQQGLIRCSSYHNANTKVHIFMKIHFQLEHDNNEITFSIFC